MLEASIGNSAHALGDPPGLDLRGGARGYLVAAPSLHSTGRPYRWLDPEAPIAPLPETWLERLLEGSPEDRVVVALRGRRCSSPGRDGTGKSRASG